MPRVVHVKSARKPQPSIGVEVGQPYYWWKFMRGPKVVSRTPPRPSQLTRSEFMGPYLSTIEALEDTKTEDPGSVAEALRSVIEVLEGLRDETQEKLDNMPPGLQEGDTGQLMQERIDAVEEWLSTVEDVADRAEDGDCDEAPDDLMAEVLGADPGPS